ncbi:hypothetical protein [Calothrix sp. NIES-2098]|uniref:hypothetical protein n=1 Tax=Calothrix sp. NIES-2098 TaxID=1954171 RepID=UPI000B5F6FCD|nr:hypothetical protein NIES2098_72150 [Calothrix sp. NIES-2098]
MNSISQATVIIHRELENANSWLTSADLEETTGYSRATVVRRLNILMQEGIVVCQIVRPHWFYKLADEPSNIQLLNQLKSIQTTEELLARTT